MERNIYRKMTEIELKNLLCELHAVRIQESLLKECLEISEDIKSNRNIQFKIIGGTLNILNENERFIIESHLIYHHTWSETAQLFIEKNGAGSERSERTLKRIQSRALKKMVNFINRSPLKEFFHEM